MEYIIEFIDFIYNTVTSLFDFLVGIIENLIMLVEYLGVVAEICYTIIATMPDWLQAFGIITILISVLYMIIGRDTGGTKQ